MKGTVGRQKGQSNGLGLSCNWIFPTGVQSVETKLSYIQSSVKKKKDKLESRHPAALFTDYPVLWPLIKKGPAVNWTLWELLWHVFPSEGCLGNPLEGLAEVFPFPRAGAHFFRHTSCREHRVEVCVSLSLPSGQVLLQIICVLNCHKCSTKFCFGKLTSEFLALLTSPLQGPDGNTARPWVL